MSIVHWFDGHHCSIHWKEPLSEEHKINDEPGGECS